NNAVDRISDLTSGDISRHRLRNRHVMNRTTAFRHHAYDIALRQNAREPAVDPKDHHRSDAMLGEQLGCGGKFAARIVSKLMVALREGPLHGRVPVSALSLERQTPRHKGNVRFGSETAKMPSRGMPTLPQKADMRL